MTKQQIAQAIESYISGKATKPGYRDWWIYCTR